MGAKKTIETTVKTQAVTGKVSSEDEVQPVDGWVSPEVLAAQAGEQVEFGKNVPTGDEPDTDA